MTGCQLFQPSEAWFPDQMNRLNEWSEGPFQGPRKSSGRQLGCHVVVGMGEGPTRFVSRRRRLSECWKIRLSRESGMDR